MFPLIWPIKIHRPKKNKPYITYTIVGICSIIYLIEVILFFTSPSTLINLVQFLSFKVGPTSWFTWFTSMFLHADPLHIIGNMYFLYLFGSLVEDVLGRYKYTVLYLASGFAGAFLHGLVTFAGGTVSPAIGASGAIMGLVAVAMMRFKQNKITLGYFIFIFVFVKWGTFQITVFAAAFIYFIEQLLSGLLSVAGVVGSNIAYWGHLGGFLAGFLAVYILQLEAEADAEYMAEDAASNSRTGDFHAATAKYEELIRTDPANPVYQRNAGRAWAMAGDYKKAEMRLLKSFNQFLAKGKKEEASQVYEEMIKICPKCDFDAETLYKVAVLCESRHKFQASLNTLERLIDEYPNCVKSETAAFRLGQVMLKMGSTEEAYEQFKSFIEKYPQSEWAPLAKSYLEKQPLK